MNYINNLATTAHVLAIISGGGHSIPATQNRPLEPPIKPIKQIARLSDSKLPQTLPKLELASLPVSPAGTYQNDYDYGNCTEHVASMVKVPNTMGDANQWARKLGSLGYTVSSTPIVGAIAQSTAGYYGHVAVVLAVSRDQVKVSEANVDGLNVVDERWYSISHFNNYIYV